MKSFIKISFGMSSRYIFFPVFFCSLVLGGDCFAGERDFSPYPRPDIGYVSDFASLLSDEQQEQLEILLSATEEETNVEIVVVTVNSFRDFPGTSNRTIEAFATALFNVYGIGNMPENNGVLLLVSVKDRKARIELGAGYGRRRDSDASRIMNNKIVPYFRKGQYAKGIIEGTEGLIKEFGNVFIIPFWIIAVAASVFVFVMVLVVISLFMSGKRGWGWIMTGLLILGLLGILWLIVRTVRTVYSSRGGGGGFGGGGFGGGFSGGGGATGSW